MPLQSPLLEGERRKRTCEQVVGPQLGAKGLGPGKIPFGKPTWSAQSLSQIILVSFHSSVAYPGVLGFLQAACILRKLPYLLAASAGPGASPHGHSTVLLNFMFLTMLQLLL